ncbi:hypothetical protein D9M72_622200 [compost metagenome]
MAGAGACSCEGAVLRLVDLRGQHGGEIQIARLVVRRVGIGQVVGQHFCPLGAETEGLLMDAEGFVEADAHGHEPLPVWACHHFSKVRARSFSLYESGSWAILPAAGGKGFPPGGKAKRQA